MSDPQPLPLGYPTESDEGRSSLQATAMTAPSVAPNTSRPEANGPHGGPRISQRRLADIFAQLSERDMDILRSVDRYRFLSSRQIEALHFTGHASPESAQRTCRRVLARLRDYRVLGILDRRIGGIRAGSEGLVYFMDTAGDRILRQGEPGRSRRRFDEPSARFLDHTLAIVDVAVELTKEMGQRGGEVVRIDPELHGRRHYQGVYGTEQVVRPDLYVELAARPDDDEVHAFFVEIDLGNEALPTLLAKCQAYEDYRASGIEQTEYGGFPRIVWAMDAFKPATAERRQRALREALNARQQTPADYRIHRLADTARSMADEVCHG